MQKVESPLDGVLILTPTVYEDDRGLFFESYNSAVFSDIVGKHVDFVQDNQSTSYKGVIRGLHYQISQAQGKLVRVVNGKIFDVVADIRRGSPTFGACFTVELCSEKGDQLWIPPGYAHGFMALTNLAVVSYKTTDFYAPQFERTIIWNDRDLNIAWPSLDCPLSISDKDLAGKTLKDAEIPALKI